MVTTSEKELRRRAKQRFAVATRMEKEYFRSLRMVADQIDKLVKGMVRPGATYDSVRIQQALDKYAEAIEPWAEANAEKIVSRIIDKDAVAWIELSKSAGKALRKELNEAPTGLAFQQFMAEQVKLIKSLPIEAGQRVHKLVIEGAITGRRAEHIREEILKTGQVTRSRAQLIARTEVARTAAGITQARAKAIGSTHYYWRTSGDHDVRDSHKKMNGKIIAWDQPPEVDPGKYYHAGMFPNCRCYPEPILDEKRSITVI